MTKVLVSACLLGERVRYDGQLKAVANPVLARWVAEGRVVPVCPEVAGGLPVPRPPAEQQLDGRVVTVAGVDVTSAFAQGAARALALAAEHAVGCAVLKESSPSCGSSRVHDGSFRGQEVPGAGVTTQALRAAGVPVFSEQGLADADALLRSLDIASRSR